MAGSRPGRQTTGSRTPRHALSPVWRTSYQIAHSPSLCVRPRSSPPERDHSQLPRSPPRPRRGLPREAPRTRIREAFQPEQPSELPGILKGAGVGNVPISCPGVPAVFSNKSPGICPGAECSQSVFPGPSASPGKLQIIGPIPGPLNQTQGAGRSGGPDREETAGEGPAQAWQGILTGLEQRSPSSPHGPLPVHTAHFRSTRPTSGPQGPLPVHKAHFRSTRPTSGPHGPLPAHKAHFRSTRPSGGREACKRHTQGSDHSRRAWRAAAAVQSLSRVRLFCDPIHYSLPDPSTHGLPQARILEWGVISFFRGSSRSRDQTHVTRIKQADSLPLSHQGSPASRKHHNRRIRQRCSLSSITWGYFRRTSVLPCLRFSKRKRPFLGNK